MLFTRKYPLELRLEVIRAHRDREGGYRKLAKRYGLDRDLVRFWILDRKRKQRLAGESIQAHARDTVGTPKKDPEVEKELEDLRLQVAYYKKLSEILEEECDDVKKKREAERFKRSHQKDAP